VGALSRGIVSPARPASSRLGPQLTRPARRLLAAIFVVALFQNLIFVMFFRSHVAIESNAALLAVSLVKSGTLLLYLLWLVWYKDLLLRLAGPGSGHTICGPRWRLIQLPLPALERVWPAPRTRYA
jgi:hypothetical protein